eukprot:GILI01008891.1.p1 GENE.GILI01008891.1~~GILI01008891.1.p1  ORF type:complete len:703 (-),score=76.22 GILI01008891.1:120-2228(-)
MILDLHKHLIGAISHMHLFAVVFKFICFLKWVLSLFQRKPFLEEYVAIKLFGTQVLAIRRMAAGFKDIRQVYAEAQTYEAETEGQSEEYHDEEAEVVFPDISGGILSSRSTSVVHSSRPPSAASGRINTPFLSANDADFDKAESISTNCTLFRTGDERHGDIVLVWLAMPWDPAFLTAFACRLAASVGCHCAVVKVMHLSGSSSMKASVTAVVEDITTALATIEHRCILLGGCEVAGTIALHAITANAFGDSPPIAAILFDPFVGWRTTVVTPTTSRPNDKTSVLSGGSASSNSTSMSTATSGTTVYFGSGGEVIEERADPSLSIGLEETTVGALINRFASDVDEWYGGRIRSWFPSWVGGVGGPAATNQRSPSMSPKTRSSQFGANATSSTYNPTTGRPPAITLASPTQHLRPYLSTQVPHPEQPISCTILMCCDSQNVWAHQLRDFQRCLAVRGVDIALEEYVSANPDSAECSAYLLGFMEDCEMWLEKAANVGRFACGSSVFSQGTRRSGVSPIGGVNTWRRRFRSLAGVSRSLTPVSVLLGHSASNESLFDSYQQTMVGGLPIGTHMAMPHPRAIGTVPWPGSATMGSADSVSCATTPIKRTPIAGSNISAVCSAHKQARRRPSLNVAKRDPLEGERVWGIDRDARNESSKDSVREEGLPVGDAVSTPRKVIVRASRTPRVSTTRKPTRGFDPITPLQ